jgi:hypothetical protein
VHFKEVEIMSFGLTDYSGSNYDYSTKTSEDKKGITSVNSTTNPAKEQENVSFQTPEGNQEKPLVQNNVKTYKNGGAPAMLDFGLFDYRNNQKNSILNTLANKDFHQDTQDGFNAAMQQVGSYSPPRTGGSHANYAMTEKGEASAGVNTLEKMQQIIQQSKA